jgi:ribosomal protein S20
MKKIIRLDESYLRKIIKESIESVIKKDYKNINESYGEERNSGKADGTCGLSIFDDNLGDNHKIRLYKRINTFYKNFINTCNILKQSFLEDDIDDLDLYLEWLISKLNDLQNALQDARINVLVVKNVIKHLNNLKNEGNIENVKRFITYELEKVIKAIGDGITEQMQY